LRRKKRSQSRREGSGRARVALRLKKERKKDARTEKLTPTAVQKKGGNYLSDDVEMGGR